MTTSQIENAVNKFKQFKSKIIVQALRKSKINNDEAALRLSIKHQKGWNAIESIQSYSQNIVAPADKKLLIF